MSAAVSKSLPRRQRQNQKKASGDVVARGTNILQESTDTKVAKWRCDVSEWRKPNRVPNDSLSLFVVHTVIE